MTPPDSAPSDSAPSDSAPSDSAPSDSAPSERERLLRLLHKYDVLAELRAARARGEAIPEKKVFRELAAEMPGALHELDRLSMDAIEARREALREATKGGTADQWMRLMVDYHALYRAALFVKGRVRRKADLTADETSALAKAASLSARTAITPDFVRAVLRPPGGRIGQVVLAETAARAGETPSAVLQSIFPTRRDLKNQERRPDSHEPHTVPLGEDRPRPDSHEPQTPPLGEDG